MGLPILLERLHQDVSYAVRALRKQPVLALSAIATLALGIGANTAIFTVVNTVLLRPLPYPDPDNLVRLSGGATFTRYEMIKTAGSFAAVGAFNAFTSDITLSRGDEVPEGIKAVRVSANLLSVLGLRPKAGRGFVPAEESDGSCAAMISEGLWIRRFAGSAGAVGSVVEAGGVPCTLVGVLPRDLSFPYPDADLWLPLQPGTVLLQARMHSPGLSVIARLKPGTGLRQAVEEVRLLTARYGVANPGALDAKPGRPENVVVLKDQLVKGIRPSLWMLMGAVGFLLAIACANITGLLLVRARSRSREVAVRVALGASQGRLTLQLLVESLLLALAGGALGIAGAGWLVRGIDWIPGLRLPPVGAVHLDGTVLLCSTALSIATGVLFGLAPSRLAIRADPLNVLRGGGEDPASYGSEGRNLFAYGSRNGLVIFQVALSTVLVIGAVLLIESVARLRRVDLGFEAQNLLTMRLTLPRAVLGSTTGMWPDFQDLVTRVEAIPGVQSAAVSLTLPATGFAGTPVWPVDQAPPALNKRPIAVLQAVTPGYFRTLGVRLRWGRDLAPDDSRSSPKVAVINEALARRFWPGYPRENPVGHSILAGASLDALRIVGIVSDVRQGGPAESPDPAIYRPRAQMPPMSAMLAVRTKGDSLAVASAIRAEVASVDRGMSVTAVKTMNEVLGESDGQRRGLTILLGLFASTGLLLTCVGIYGVVAYSVAARTREFGIRKALGAGQADVLKLVLGQGVKLTLTGSLLGLSGAGLLTRFLEGLLFEVSPTDPWTFCGVAALWMGVAMVASYLPARRAMKVEPVVAFRSDR